MKKQAVIKPTEAELEILQVLWNHGPSTVREVHDNLTNQRAAGSRTTERRTAERRTVGYTTTLKNMQNMVQKKLLLRDDTQRSHVYAAAIRQVDTQRMLLDRFLDTAFGGSASQLVMQTLGNQKTSPEELQQIKALIAQLENKSQ
ncbi:MAG: BlaI/MecI/CopY family transcriptional regulator [Tunicatimonas sp.]